MIALGIAVAAPLHAFAMPPSCAQMTAEGPVSASMDCAQHCSVPGVADPMIGFPRYPAASAQAGGTPPAMPVLPELEASLPRPGTAA